jgi:hypothetical protein
MKRYFFLIALGLVAASTTAFAQTKSTQKKASMAKNEKVRVDTSACRSIDQFFTDDMMRDMSRSSRSFYNQAMKMMQEMPDIQGMISSEDFAGMDRFFSSDSTQQRKGINRKGMAGKRPHMRGNRFTITTDSSGNQQSIKVISKDGKTTIIRNGKDTTFVDGPFVPERDMPNMNFDMLVPPSFDMMPNFGGRDFQDRDFVVRRSRGGLEAESPSVQENDLLVKKGIVSSKDIKSRLDVEDLSLVQNRKNGTVRISYELENAEQSELQLVSPEGTVVEKVTLIGNDGEFRRTIKMDKTYDYVYVVISNSKKVSVGKFWL